MIIKENQFKYLFTNDKLTNMDISQIQTKWNSLLESSKLILKHLNISIDPLENSRALVETVNAMDQFYSPLNRDKIYTVLFHFFTNYYSSTRQNLKSEAARSINEVYKRVKECKKYSNNKTVKEFYPEIVEANKKFIEIEKILTFRGPLPHKKRRRGSVDYKISNELLAELTQYLILIRRKSDCISKNSVYQHVKMILQPLHKIITDGGVKKNFLAWKKNHTLFDCAYHFGQIHYRNSKTGRYEKYSAE